MSAAATKNDFRRESGLLRMDRILEGGLVFAGKLSRLTSQHVFSLFSKAVRAFASRAAMTVVQLDGDTKFAFPLGDNYWSKAFFLRAQYEPELARLLLALRDVPYGFIDCGANFGFWSVLVSGRRFGSKKALAIEMSEDNVAVLRSNASLNGRRFGILQRAIFSRSGEKLNIFGKNHFGHTVVPGTGHKSEQPTDKIIETITLDECLNSFGKKSQDCFVVKLDIEGAEIHAVEGSAKLRQMDVLWLYEDERDDAVHATTSALMRDFNLVIFALSATEGPRRVHNVEELTRLKSRRNSNFAAVGQNSQWMRRLADVSAGRAVN